MLFQDIFSYESYRKKSLPKLEDKKSLIPYSIIPFLIGVTIFYYILQFLFYAQASTPGTTYFLSDLKFHIYFGLEGWIYSTSQVVSWISGILRNTFFNNDMFVHMFNSAALAIAVVLSIFFTRKLVIRLMDGKESYATDFIALSAFLVTMIFIPTDVTSYLHAGSPNVWHNSTILYCRLFAILVVDKMLESIESYYRYKLGEVTRQTVILNYSLLALYSVLCMFSKPSFAVAFMPACFIYMLIKLFKTKGESFYPSFFTGLAFVPSLPVIFIQNAILYADTVTESQIVFSPFAYPLVFNSSIYEFLWRLLLSSLFPLFIYLVSIKKLKSIEHIIYTSYFIGIFLFAFLSESHERLEYGNLSWSLIVTLSFAFIVATCRLFSDKTPKFVKYIGFPLLTMHLISGVFYFERLLAGKHFG